MFGDQSCWERVWKFIYCSMCKTFGDPFCWERVWKFIYCFVSDNGFGDQSCWERVWKFIYCSMCKTFGDPCCWERVWKFIYCLVKGFESSFTVPCAKPLVILAVGKEFESLFTLKAVFIYCSMCKTFGDPCCWERVWKFIYCFVSDNVSVILAVGKGFESLFTFPCAKPLVILAVGKGFESLFTVS